MKARERAARLVVLVAVAAALGACTAGPDFVRPTPPPAERYTRQPLAIESAASAGGQRLRLGEAMQGDWWRPFASPELDAIVRRSIARNRTLAVAAANLAQARELVAAQAGALAPQVAWNAGAGRIRYGAETLGDSPRPPFTYFSIGATVSYELDAAGGLARSVERQQALAQVEGQRLEAAYLAVTGNAVMGALRIAGLREQIATAEGLIDQDRENVQLVRVAFDAGTVSRLDVIAAESQLAADGTLLPPLRQQLAVAGHALAVVAGTSPARAALPQLDLDRVALPRELPARLPSELAHRRPDILAAEAQVHVATAALGMAEADLYPHITLSASAGPQSTDLAHLLDPASAAWSAAAGLLGPLFDGGTLHARRRAAAEALRGSVAGYEQTVLVAFAQVADALEALEHDAEELAAQANAREAARANVDLTRRSYREGNVGVLQVLDAERGYQRAQLGFVRARAQRYLDTAQLFLALGGSSPPAELAQGARTGKNH